MHSVNMYSLRISFILPLYSTFSLDSPNFPPLAMLGANITLSKELTLPQPRGPFRVHKQLDSKILVLKLVPGFDDDSIHVKPISHYLI